MTAVGGDNSGNDRQARMDKVWQEVIRRDSARANNPQGNSAGTSVGNDKSSVISAALKSTGDMEPADVSSEAGKLQPKPRKPLGRRARITIMATTLSLVLLTGLICFLKFSTVGRNIVDIASGAKAARQQAIQNEINKSIGDRLTTINSKLTIVNSELTPLMTSIAAASDAEVPDYASMSQHAKDASNALVELINEISNSTSKEQIANYDTYLDKLKSMNGTVLSLSVLYKALGDNSPDVQELDGYGYDYEHISSDNLNRMITLSENISNRFSSLNISDNEVKSISQGYGDALKLIAQYFQSIKSGQKDDNKLTSSQTKFDDAMRAVYSLSNQFLSMRQDIDRLGKQLSAGGK